MSTLRNLLTNKVLKFKGYAKLDRKKYYEAVRPEVEPADKRPPYWKARLGAPDDKE